MSDGRYKTLAESSDSRWWEFYFIRYAMGSVVGSLIVFFLFYIGRYYSSEQAGHFFYNLELLFKLGNYGLLILPLLGLSYCYLSSAPILVMHACRSTFKNMPEIKAFSLIVIFCFLLMLGVIFTSGISKIFIISIVFLIAVVITQFYLIYSTIGERKDYYNTLCGKRSGSDESKKEYIESYKHLREHGNAFMIVMMEIILAVILLGVSSPKYLFAVVIAWILPAAYVWFIGSYLESDL